MTPGAPGLTELVDREAPGLREERGEAPQLRRSRRRRRRTLIATGLGLLLILLGLIALTTGQSSGGTLDPRSASPDGTRALAELLRDRGVQVTRGTQSGSGVTVLVPFPEELFGAGFDALLSSGSDVVLVDPGSVAAADLSPAGSLAVRTRQPGCPLRAARVAGSAHLGGTRYASPHRGVSCYDGALLALPRDTVDGGGTVTVVGSSDFLMNKRLDEQGNAALAIGLLADNPTLTWYSARPTSSDKTLTDLLPSSVRWAFLQLGIAVVVVALWRARRLGPVVTEPLPVVVRAAETVLGRARLYAAARARRTAAQAIRAGARARLATLVHLDPNDAGRRPEALIAAVAARSGVDAVTVAGVLYEGGSFDAAASDASLVRLPGELDRLEQLVKSR